jgi:hypothetical protein
MRFSPFLLKLFTVFAVLTVTGCAGTGVGENSAFAKSSRKAQALAALERPNLTPKDLFAPRLPKRQIKSLAVVGDSLSIGLASELEKNLGAKPGLAFTSLGKVSSGLARPDFFDWDRHLDTLARRYRPEAVVVMLGTNDNKPLKFADGSQIAYASPEWDKAYAARVRRVVEIVRSHNPSAMVFWMGAPVMADGDLSHDLRHINGLIRKTLADQGECYYVDTWPLFSDASGGFAFSKPDLAGGAALRARDGVHLTTAGAQTLAVHCQTALETRITWDPPAPGSVPLAETGV